jgi:hypothetical protein
VGGARLIRLLAPIALFFSAPALCAAAPEEWSATFYAAQVSGEAAWHDVLRDPIGAKYIDTYVVAGAIARPYAAFFGADALRLEAEGQVAYNFGGQHHWELNVMPVMARWSRFPWSERVPMSVAFGLGLSHATEMPEVEVELEGSSHRTLIYWALELTASPPRASWEMLLRLHHRSPAWGLMGEEGGINAVGLGFRYRFARD